MTGFIEEENRCQMAFDRVQTSYGGIWHLYTPGDKVVSFIRNEDDFKYAVSNAAISALESGVTVITDQIMNNHIHSILACRKEQCFDFLDHFRYRENKRYSDLGIPFDLTDLTCDNPIAVTSLKMVRNEIVYVNRNGFLVNQKYSPFSYPWGGGSLYFNTYAQEVEGIPVKELPFKVKRALSRRSNMAFPNILHYKNGMILPNSYVDWRTGQSFFRNAHQYFNLLSKHYEAYGAEAKRLGESIVVSDEEMYSVLMMFIKRDYKNTSPSLLTPKEKMEIAIRLHNDYHASNSQLRRLLGLDNSVIETMFPRIQR